jgi:V8-like Glu-specific endopeptidase
MKMRAYDARRASNVEVALPDSLGPRLTRELAERYPDHVSIRRLLQQAEVPSRGLISFSEQAVDTWHSALWHTRRQRKMADLLKVIVAEEPGNDTLNAALYQELEQQSAHPPKAFGWHREVPADQLEKLMGKQSTLLPISFLNVGLSRAKAVAHIACHDGSDATGFLTSGDLIVTTNHAISSPSDATGAIAEFGYDQERGASGSVPPATVRFEPTQGFVTSATHDCTVVRVESGASAQWGSIPVNHFDTGTVNWVNIIQHPGGGPKRIALYHNVVSYSDADIVQYYTDTLPGSSGSPVFDSGWNLVAVHRAGGDLYEPGGNRVVYRNEGVNVNRVADLLVQLS